MRIIVNTSSMVDISGKDYRTRDNPDIYIIFTLHFFIYSRNVY
jgi:hypothetical protein